LQEAWTHLQLLRKLLEKKIVHHHSADFRACLVGWRAVGCFHGFLLLGSSRKAGQGNEAGGRSGHFKEAWIRFQLLRWMSEKRLVTIPCLLSALAQRADGWLEDFVLFC
jgi:hypothetical protein